MNSKFDEGTKKIFTLFDEDKDELLSETEFANFIRTTDGRTLEDVEWEIVLSFIRDFKCEYCEGNHGIGLNGLREIHLYDGWYTPIARFDWNKDYQKLIELRLF